MKKLNNYVFKKPYAEELGTGKQPLKKCPKARPPDWVGVRSTRISRRLWDTTSLVTPGDLGKK